MNQTLQKLRRWSHAVTLLELLVVVLIIGILSTIAVGVYTGQVRRARIAATSDLIRQLEIAITRYEIDMGSFPPSGSGSGLSLGPATTRNMGTGYLHVALVHSMSGSIFTPASQLWGGPYISLQEEQLAPEAETFFDTPGRINIIDAWGNALWYVNSSDYDQVSGTFFGGTDIFTSNNPQVGTNPLLPAPNPFAGLGETNYNQATYQIISRGPDGVTAVPPFHGTLADDITNFGY